MFVLNEIRHKRARYKERALYVLRDRAVLRFDLCGSPEPQRNFSTHVCVCVRARTCVYVSQSTEAIMPDMNLPALGSCMQY